jgi:hypothetical protein
MQGSSSCVGARSEACTLPVTRRASTRKVCLPPSATTPQLGTRGKMMTAARALLACAVLAFAVGAVGACGGDDRPQFCCDCHCGKGGLTPGCLVWSRTPLKADDTTEAESQCEADCTSLCEQKSCEFSDAAVTADECRI